MEIAVLMLPHLWRIVGSTHCKITAEIGLKVTCGYDCSMKSVQPSHGLITGFRVNHGFKESPPIFSVVPVQQFELSHPRKFRNPSGHVQH